MPQKRKRWMMRQTLTEQPEASPWSARPISQQDGPLLGKLMYDAYHGTIDDEGETPEEALKEIEGTLAGKYGPLLSTCSFLIEEQGRVLAASLLLSNKFGIVTSQARFWQLFLATGWIMQTPSSM